ncbi:MAG: hypothetical protein KDK78_08860, partial [Chlamydiia bacterium]|nr:hypothetical protein [Chlamydiia bacterium]
WDDVPEDLYPLLLRARYSEEPLDGKDAVKEYSSAMANSTAYAGEIERQVLADYTGYTVVVYKHGQEPQYAYPNAVEGTYERSRALHLYYDGNGAHYEALLPN